MKKFFFTIAISVALFLSVSSYSKAGTADSKKGSGTKAQQENTCCGECTGCGESTACVEGSCH